MNDYRTFLLSSTHGEVQEYLDSLHFTSLGSTMYGEAYLSEPVTEEQSINYLFNTDQIFQVKNAIMKPIDEVNEEVKWQFLLTVAPEYLNNNSYEKLKDGIFDSDEMKKFATNPVDSTVNLFEFIRNTPVGYEETTPNSSQAARPMFGRRTKEEVTCSQPFYHAQTHQCVRSCERTITTTTYIFWHPFVNEEVVGSWTESSEGCQ